MKRGVWLAALLFLAVDSTWAAKRFPVSGMILKVDKEHRTLVVSHGRIPGFMDAMVMPFHVREPKVLEGLQPGMRVDFTLVVGKGSSYAEKVRIKNAETIERDPFQARRLQLLNTLLAPAEARENAVAIGQPVPDFELTDQNRRPVALSQFAGKVVVVTFIYTRCPLSDYCPRLSDNFARLQKRFRDRMGRDLELLSVTFDPQNDTPEVLTDYARIWKADPDAWRFLTGPMKDIRRVCGLFGVDFWPDEGLLAHSLRTAIIDRQGRLAANVTGSDLLPQLGDLVETVMERPQTGSGGF